MLSTLVFFMQAFQCVMDRFFIADEQRYSLVQAAGLNIQNPLITGRGNAASLFNNKT